MTDGVGTSGRGIGGAQTSPTVYQAPELREVQARAAFLEQRQSREEQDGLRRLNGFLTAGRQLDANAPRGFHLNIRV